jgi:hypothetical protein
MKEGNMSKNLMSITEENKGLEKKHIVPSKFTHGAITLWKDGHIINPRKEIIRVNKFFPDLRTVFFDNLLSKDKSFRIENGDIDYYEFISWGNNAIVRIEEIKNKKRVDNVSINTLMSYELLIDKNISIDEIKTFIIYLTDDITFDSNKSLADYTQEHQLIIKYLNDEMEFEVFRRSSKYKLYLAYGAKPKTLKPHMDLFVYGDSKVPLSSISEVFSDLMRKSSLSDKTKIALFDDGIIADYSVPNLHKTQTIKLNCRNSSEKDYVRECQYISDLPNGKHQVTYKDSSNITVINMDGGFDPVKGAQLLSRVKHLTPLDQLPSSFFGNSFAYDVTCILMRINLDKK